MDGVRRRMLVAGITAASLGAGASAGAGSPFDHGDWSRVLERFVDGSGRVDYDGLAAGRSDLDRYLERLATEGPRTTPERFPSKSDELAYYVNAYNAFVFQGVIEGDPDAETVWTGLVPGYSFFVGRKFRLDGEKINLRNLENKVVRARFGDARIHAALNCASTGCPRLPMAAFDSGQLNDALDRAMTEFVSDPKNVRVDAAARTVHLSKIFDWYEEDFLADEREAGNGEPTLIDYVNRFRTGSPGIPRDYTVRFLEYDKSLNDRPEDEAD